MGSFYQHTYKSLIELWRQNQLPEDSVSLLYNWHYKKKRLSPCEHHNLPRAVESFVAKNFSFELPRMVSATESADKTVKFLFEFTDSKRVETVLIPFQGKYTVCLSSQVGCAMNCSFCFTGTQGLSRNLTTDEIVGQFMAAQKWLTENRPDDDSILNIVYMGQGEPMHNFDAVRDSAQIFISQHGLSLAGHKITVSTSGYTPGLIRWKNEMPDVNIALSLHSPYKHKRDQLIPINRRFPLEEIIPLVEAIPTGKKRFVTYEYLLIKNFNDSEDDARATGRLLQGTKAFINLIPFNPFPGSRYEKPDRDQVIEFKSILEEYRIPATIRTTKGDEILAACGQLNSQLRAPELSSII